MGGICRSSSGGVVAGWGGWPKSAGECQRMCESRNSCIGYTAVTTGGTGTCYVHGRFTENNQMAGLTPMVMFMRLDVLVDIIILHVTNEFRNSHFPSICCLITSGCKGNECFLLLNY